MVLTHVTLSLARTSSSPSHRHRMSCASPASTPKAPEGRPAELGQGESLSKQRFQNDELVDGPCREDLLRTFRQTCPRAKGDLSTVYVSLQLSGN
ncbi:hypothetical protein EYF80_005602 [Liparis tanakae]|uniref:Uncharacterized protein n=1 Tax=Liparis tanakae TaxID=230148 RepID=A0A4Z2J1R1_9TELE|nr:hypothetical protein EYF80_005602 [Liparis tanakae]